MNKLTSKSAMQRLVGSFAEAVSNALILYRMRRYERSMRSALTSVQSMSATIGIMGPARYSKLIQRRGLRALHLTDTMMHWCRHIRNLHEECMRRGEQREDG